MRVGTGMIAVGADAPPCRTGPAEPLTRRRHLIGAEPSLRPAEETILPAALGLVDAARADGANPRAVGVARLMAADRPAAGWPRA